MRWAASPASIPPNWAGDAEWRPRLHGGMRRVEDRLQAIGAIDPGPRAGSFNATLCLAHPDGRDAIFEGRVDGHHGLAAARRQRLWLRPGVHARWLRHHLRRDAVLAKPGRASRCRTAPAPSPDSCGASAWHNRRIPRTSIPLVRPFSLLASREAPEGQMGLRCAGPTMNILSIQSEVVTGHVGNAAARFAPAAARP